jgi:hypothetical protein
MRWCAIIVVAVALVAARGGHAEVAPAAGGYLGADACGACHRAELASWRTSAHARASRPLSAEERTRRACQACHATGDAPAAPATWADVGCEACHGAGATYAADDVMRDPPLAEALGLRPLATPAARAALCLGCHDVGRAPFDVEAAWARIAHGGRR